MTESRSDSVFNRLLQHYLPRADTLAPARQVRIRAVISLLILQASPPPFPSAHHGPRSQPVWLLGAAGAMVDAGSDRQDSPRHRKQWSTMRLFQLV